VSLTNPIAEALAKIVSAEQILYWKDWSVSLDRVLQAPPEALWVACPQTIVQLSKVMALAYQQGWTVLTTGQGSKLSWGGLEKNIDLVISTAGLNRLIDHAVADMTVTVEAGMPFSQLQTLLEKHQQWLPLDPAYPDQATVGFWPQGMVVRCGTAMAGLGIYVWGYLLSGPMDRLLRRAEKWLKMWLAMI
jgi:glycolate oxidase FAD binding subunit